MTALDHCRKRKGELGKELRIAEAEKVLHDMQVATIEARINELTIHEKWLENMDKPVQRIEGLKETERKAQAEIG